MDGKKIRDLRMKKGMSLTELAKLSGISKSYLSFIERGKQTNPSIEVIEKISKALSVDLQSLLTSNKLQKQIEPPNLDKEVIQLAIEMSNSNIDKEKLRQLINLLK
ncbi:putative transcriptional regulator [Schinkia azotoformans MEV2011]|uniref:Putative transcriptional regulator n=1 Tax=Schinkia azotoformans MEV2011 TaxID=1348973 RepID=A0A072NJ80_SCHAZ|nr:helix-turn-helix transcriptional regulator [Schinkia azotoformans]KEF37754.1 putative transcriptional regulator [Schinkia azotoformans MEV2011]MEC1695627.1 helix-turn-helix transcriptional regulator [Schinkia azotoformans]MEC1717202.1 helix-turn-helix transcriptional regulator [Schinkia azotoformans]MEC1726554.1 helix-turn-helix transcriptional regulator [Schinkia azotoformans]MEC1742016.1 helix-turn-helix transcriptional regulator [Schinkia azotoformans]